MKTYCIVARGNIIEIKADEFTYDGNGLRFYTYSEKEKKEMIACFVSWEGCYLKKGKNEA